MRVLVELELEVTTEPSEVEGCTKENFQDHVKIVLRDTFQADHGGELNYICMVKKIEFPENYIE